MQDEYRKLKESVKKLVKKNDENLEILKNENKDLKVRLQEYERKSKESIDNNQTINDLKSKIELLETENNIVQKNLESIQDKYESIRC